MKKLSNKIIILFTVFCMLMSISLPTAFAAEGEIEQSIVGELTQSTENIETPVAAEAQESEKTEETAISGESVQPMSVSSPTEDVINYHLNSIVIKKTSAVTGELLAGAVFEVSEVNPSVSGTSGTIIGRYTTDYTGVVVVTGLEPGGYIVKEVQPPQNYMLSENSQQQAWLKADGTSIVEVVFSNYPYGNLLVKKVDATTNTPLSGAGFFVTTGAGAAVGENNGRYTTDHTGSFLISNLKPGAYVVREEIAPSGYLLDTTPQTIQIGTDGKTYSLSFTNKPIGGLLIKKYDSITREPLAGAIFRITDISGAVIGTGDGMYTSDSQGNIYIPGLKPGGYKITETQAPYGYKLNNNTQTIQISDHKIYTLEFVNEPLNSLTISKMDGDSKSPLAGATIKVTKADDTFVAERTTDSSGKIVLTGLQDGYYKVFETVAPTGYILNGSVKLVNITGAGSSGGGNPAYVEIYNYKQGGIQINKVDAITNKGLHGAVYEVRKIDGTLIGSNYTTDNTGNVLIPNLQPGWYTATEITPPSGYQNSPQNVDSYNSNSGYYNNVSYYISGSKVYFTYNGITYYASGSTAYYIENGYTYKGHSDDADVYTYTSGGIVRFRINGITYYSQGTQPYYIMNGTTYSGFPDYYPNSNTDWATDNGKAVGGYKLIGSVTQNVQVVAGSNTTVQFKDYQYATLTIKKIDHTTGKPLANVTFTVTQDNGLNKGTYKTDANGLIKIVDLEPGNFNILETQNPNEGYDRPSSEPKTVSLNWGDSKVVTFENYKLATVNVVKVNDNGEPMADVAILLLDSNKNVIQTGVTDVQGNLVFNGLRAGTYYWQEVVPEGYTNSPLPTMFTLNWSDAKIINITNVISKGQIHIMKVSDGNNNTTGQLDGARLPGATFVVKDENNKVVDTLTTDQNGSAVSKALPYGHYVVWETQAPHGYHKTNEPSYVDITEDGMIYDIIIKNKPLELGLTIAKTGIYETQAGDSFYYTISNVANTSNVALTNFNWVDSIPTYAIRLQKIETGAYSHQVNLTVSFRTNYNTDWRDWGSNIDTTQNSELNFGNVLGQDEYVTEIRFNYGTVPEGFRMVEEARIYATTLCELENGFSFTNNIHLSGTSEGEVIHAYDSWTTKVWKLKGWTPCGKLPQTGGGKKDSD